MTVDEFISTLEELECTFELLQNPNGGKCIYHRSPSGSLWGPVEMTYVEKFRKPRGPWAPFPIAWRLIGLDSGEALNLQNAIQCHKPYNRRLRTRILKATGIR